MNIPNFKHPDGHYAKYVTKGSKRNWTYSGQVWNAMRGRCKEGGCVQETFPSYIGCKMSPEFAIFDKFVLWHENQVGFGVYGYDLDKDLLVPGNKIYGVDTCILIPCSLNSFLATTYQNNGCLPGVRKTISGTFRAQIKINGKNIELGTHKTMEIAYQIYKEAKYKERDRWVSRLESGEFIVDLKVTKALKIWQLENRYASCP
jgi:hypothetical protein